MKGSTTLPKMWLCGLLLVVSGGCDDGKDSGDAAAGGSDGPTRSIDLGACPEAGLAGATDLPLVVVSLPSGVAQMGDAADSDAAPVHEVTLTRGFSMAATEVTQGQWTALGFPNPSQAAGCLDCPVEQVTWHEAAAYANALSTDGGLETCYTCSGSGADTSCTPPADPYACGGWRLPTEAEWEYAAGYDVGTYAGSDDFTLVAWTAEAVGRPCPVGTLAPTQAGLYDLSGNVSEWVHDGYAAYPAGPVTDPSGENSASRRSVRGGSVFEVSERARVTARVAGEGTEPLPWRGFRLVRTAE